MEVFCGGIPQRALLRGDKGVKQGGELSFAQYFGRAIKLVYPHVPLFLFAVTCLGAKAGIKPFIANELLENRRGGLSVGSSVRAGLNLFMISKNNTFNNIITINYF